jgi:hypothetical protein
MYAPRAKFEPIYIVSPIKVAIIFLTSLHCLFLFIAFLTSFWIETKYGHHGPLFSCEARLQGKNYPTSYVTYQCNASGFPHDIFILWIPLTTILLVLSFVMSFISIITANLSFKNKSFRIRYRYWLCTILLLFFVCLMDYFILIFIPLSYRHQTYYRRWAYGVHCGATLFISVSLITAILTHNVDDVQYIEAIDESEIENK